MKQQARPKRRISIWKKLLFSLVALVLFFGSVELLLYSFGIEPISADEDPFVGFAGYLPLFVETTDEQGRTVLRTAPNKRTWFNEQSFPKDKASNTVRVFCLGGSTTFGHPYEDATSFCGWLREFLPAADPSRGWEVVNAGGISYASYRVARVMEELIEYEPDLFVVYTGHNEFLERRTYPSLVNTPESLRGVAGLLAHTRTAAAFRSAFDAIRRPSPSNPPDRFTLPAEVSARLDSVVGLEAYHRDEELVRNVLAHFETNLHRIIKIAREGGAKVVFVAPASNLADCAPFKSEHRAGLSREDGAKCERFLQRADERLDAGRPAEALTLVEDALEIDDRFAAAHFQRGRCLLRLDRLDEARSAFLRARDEDVCPLRALTPMRSILIEVARAADVRVVDFERKVDAWSETGLPGRDWFLDHVHPTIEGHRRLALEIINLLATTAYLKPVSSWSEATIQEITDRVESRIDQAAHARALVTLSKTLGWAGRREEADRLALEAVELLPADTTALYQAGNAFYEQGQLDEAERSYRRVLELNATFSAAWYGLGLVAADRGRVDDAIAHFRRAVELDPDFADAHYNLGNMLMGSGAFTEAARHFQEAIRLQPDNRYAYNNLGAIAANRRKLAEAEQWFRKALAVDPDFIDAHVNLGRLYHERGELQRAAEHYQAALRRQPDHVVARQLMARLRGTR